MGPEGEAVSQHSTAHKGSDSSLIFHNDIYWTRSTSPITASRMAPETWAQVRIYISRCKQFRWQQSHPLYKKKTRATRYTELSLQQQTYSDESIESRIATFFKESLFSFHKELFGISFLWCQLKISSLFLLLSYKYLAINTSAVKVTVCSSGVWDSSPNWRSSLLFSIPRHSVVFLIALTAFCVTSRGTWSK